MTGTHRIALALATATATLSATAWIALVLLTGTSVPRDTLVVAVMAVALAVAACRAVRAGQYWVLLLAASFGALVPPDLGAAPAAFKYVGFIAVGYGIAALLLVGATRLHRPAS